MDSSTHMSAPSSDLVPGTKIRKCRYCKSNDIAYYTDYEGQLYIKCRGCNMRVGGSQDHKKLFEMWNT